MKRTVGALVLVVGIAFGAFWFWGHPHEHVPQPTADAAPDAVVKQYVRALDARDFAAAASIFPRGGTTPTWWTLHAPNIQDLQVQEVAIRNDGGKAQAATVDTTATLNNADGSNSSYPGMSWTFQLQRTGPDVPWVIVDQGQG